MIDQNHTIATIDSADFDCVQLGIKPIEVFGHPVVGQALHQAEATVDDGLGCAASLKRNLEFEFSNLLNQITLRLDEMGENFWDNFGVNFGVNFVKNFGNIFWGGHSLGHFYAALQLRSLIGPCFSAVAFVVLSRI